MSQVTVKVFRGEPRIYIRRQYQDPLKGRCISTKSLSIDDWRELKKAEEIIDVELANVLCNLDELSIPGKKKPTTTASREKSLVCRHQNVIQRTPESKPDFISVNNNEQSNSQRMECIPSVSADETSAASAELLTLLQGLEHPQRWTMGTYSRKSRS